MSEQEFFKRYSFIERTDKVGDGSFGTLYKAYDKVLNIVVAIKKYTAQTREYIY